MPGSLFGLLLALVCVVATTAAGFWSIASTHDHTVIFPSIEGCIFTVVLASFVVLGLYQWNLFEVTADRLVRKTLTFGRLRLEAMWPRQDLLEVRYGRISNKLLLRVRGHDLREIGLTSSAVTNQFIAEQLNAAFDEIGESPFQSGDIISANGLKADRHSRWNPIIIAMTVAAPISLLFGPLGCLACGLLLIGATVVAGVGGGIQKKFWM